MFSFSYRVIVNVVASFNLVRCIINNNIIIYVDRARRLDHDHDRRRDRKYTSAVLELAETRRHVTAGGAETLSPVVSLFLYSQAAHLQSEHFFF